MTKQTLPIGGIAILAISSLIIYNEIQKRNQNPPIFYLKKLYKNYNGFIFPPLGIFIKESEKNNMILLKHELIHWQQYQREGLLGFLVNYSIMAKKHGYDMNPYEIEARHKSGECKNCLTNYTNCVRNGTSKTVYNPLFRQ